MNTFGLRVESTGTGETVFLIGNLAMDSIISLTMDIVDDILILDAEDNILTMEIEE